MTICMSPRLLLESERLFFHQCGSHCQEVRRVDRKHLNRDPADRCSTGEFGSGPLEVLSPWVLSWVR